MGNGYGTGSGMGWGWLFGLLALVGIVLLIILVVRVVGGGVRHGPSSPRAAHENHPVPTGRSRARDILTDRYARGEIDSAEFQERLEHLQDD